MRIYHFNFRMTNSLTKGAIFIVVTLLLLYSIYKFSNLSSRNAVSNKLRYVGQETSAKSTFHFKSGTQEMEKDANEEADVDMITEHLQQEFQEKLDRTTKQKILESTKSTDWLNNVQREKEEETDDEEPSVNPDTYKNEKMENQLYKKLDEITNQRLRASKQWADILKKSHNNALPGPVDEDLPGPLMQPHLNSSTIHDNSFFAGLDSSSSERNVLNTNLSRVDELDTLLAQMSQDNDSTGNSTQSYNETKPGSSQQSLNTGNSSTLLLHSKGHIFSREEHKSIFPNRKMLRLLERNPSLTYKVGFLKDNTFYREVKPRSLMRKIKPCILLLHASMFTSTVWVNIGTLQILGELGYHTFAVDLPGYGRSNRTTVPYSDEEIIIYMLQLFENLGIVRPVLVTPSRSGDYVMPLVMSHPNFVNGFVAISPTHTSKYSRRFYEKLDIPTLVILGKDDESMLNWSSLDNLEHLKKKRIFAIANATTECYVDRPLTFHKLLLKFLSSLKASTDRMYHPTLRHSSVLDRLRLKLQELRGGSYSPPNSTLLRRNAIPTGSSIFPHPSRYNS